MIVCSFSEKESLLHQQNMTRLDAVQYISHGISKVQEDEDGEEIVEETVDGQQQKKSLKALDQFCINLNKKSQDGKIDPLIGRKLEVKEQFKFYAEDKKITQFLWVILALEKQQLLNLAKRIVEKNVPDIILDAVIYSLDMGALLGN